MRIKRGEKGQWNFCWITVEHSKRLLLGREDRQLGYGEYIQATDDNEFLELAFAIIRKFPVLALTENEEMKRIARMILSLEDK